jgi:hypothetical protein
MREGKSEKTRARDESEDKKSKAKVKGKRLETKLKDITKST